MIYHVYFLHSISNHFICWFLILMMVVIRMKHDLLHKKPNIHLCTFLTVSLVSFVGMIWRLSLSRVLQLYVANGLTVFGVGPLLGFV